MFYFDKDNPHVLFCDSRAGLFRMTEPGRVFDVSPDMIADVTSLPFSDGSFWHIILDPPQLTSCSDLSDMKIHYGKLQKPWEPFIKAAFDECWRVLKVNGTLIFKWNEHDIKLQRVLDCIGRRPIYGQKNTRNAKTHWLCFFKGEGGGP
ncbi:MAG: class I SAM-dependent methyltransferase [Peptococcaceae bacterium]|nr:class I SAM-dependent methyltransferase [Peptococcaceae bacterium]